MIAWLKVVAGAGSIGPGWGNGKTTVGRLCAAAFVTRCAVWIDVSQHHGCRCQLLAQSGR